MCAIIDANVVGEVFGSERTEAGEKFFDWIDKENGGRLICGGKLLEELSKSENFTKWAGVALNAGKMENIDDRDVKRREVQIQKESKLSSNDSHILALAQVSGARLLYSNDKKLHKDFKDRGLGFIYSTPESKVLTRRDLKKLQKLLDKKGLCSSPK